MNIQIRPDEIIRSIQIHRLLPGIAAQSDAFHARTQNAGAARMCSTGYGILCMLGGSCDIRIEAQQARFLLNPSDLLLLPPGSSALCQTAEPSLCLVLEINPAFFLSTLDPEILFSCCRSSLEFPELKQMFPHLISLSRLYLAKKDRKHYQILSDLYACVQILESLPSSRAEGGDKISSSSGRFLEVTDYIRSHIREPLTLQDTAAAMSLTPQYLAAFFQKSAGCTFLAYVNRRKAEFCLPWLTHTQLTDDEIAAATGFRNTGAFRKCIHDQFGDTTDAIRKQAIVSHASPSGFPLHTICPEPLQYLVSPDDISAENERNPRPAFLSKTAEPSLLHDSEIHLTLHEKMPDSWKYILNIGFASQLTDTGLRSQIQDIQDRIHFRYGRICRLLDLAFPHQIHGKMQYSFEFVFQILDFLLSIHLTPFLELGFKNEKIHTHFTETYVLSPEKDILSYYDMLLSILPDFVRSCCNRYGQDTVSQWAFEVYIDEIERTENTPTPTFPQYVDYYKRISSVIRTFIPNCQIGGTGFNTYLPLQVLEQQISMLRSLETQMDFFSIYVYGGIGHDFDTHLSLDQDLVQDKTCRAAALIQDYFPKLPVLVSEFSFCYSSRNYLNDSLFQGSFIIRYLVHHLTGIQGMGYFSLSDLNVRYRDTDEMFFGGNGLYNIHGIRKPAFYAYEFFSNLGHFLLGKGEHYIFTANSRSSLQGVLFYYAHIDETLAYSVHGEELLEAPGLHFESGPAGQVLFRFTDVLPGSYIVKRYRITVEDANPLTHWAKYCYFHSLSEKDLKFFRYLSHPRTDLSVLEVQNGEPLLVSTVLAPQEVQLLLIDLSAPSPSESPRNDTDDPSASLIDYD